MLDPVIGGKMSFRTGVIRTTGPNLLIYILIALGQLLGQPGKAKAGQCFYCCFYPLGKRGLGSGRDNTGQGIQI